jgi:FtsH-binding integral membrane protein
METNTNDYSYQPVIEIENADASRRFIANVFLWMFVALGLSAFLAYFFAHDQSLMQLLINTETGRRSGLGTAVMFAPLAFVLVMSFGISRISAPVLTILFIAFAAVMGISLSFIFLAYTSGSIAGVFITSSAVFGIMAVAGYVTQQDLTKFGSLMIMGLIGMIIASFVNYFMHSDQLSKIISYVGVAVFVGLTAYDVQKLKRIGSGLEYGSASAKKMAIMGALTLYLDFINLFLSLLRIFGRRR